MEDQDTTSVVGVRFRDKGKVYSFDATGVVLKEGDNTIVDTESGPAMGSVATGIRPLSRDKLPRTLRKVVRKATDEDMKIHEENAAVEREALAFCTERIRQRNLSMRLVDVESLFDKSKLVFYFTAESRVDFRELVKDLVRKYKTRIELRQIWVRSEARIYGGIGMCGRELCCASFLNTFAPVSIKMAKEQNMLLNPEKISGLCGRLMCCLAFEHEQYTEAKKNMPKNGKMVTIPEGTGKVVRQNILERMVVVDLGDGKEVEVPADEIRREDKNRKPATGNGKQ
ncbi:MAG: stage 0 sporulation family protein [Deltaproteobacteria bacterium]|nr:stage 0 sporulation family protein [Deltaproteobacteria bacterium]